MLPRRAVGRTFVAGVAAAAVAALQQRQSLAFAGEIGEQGTVLVIGQDLRTHRYFDDQVIAARAGAVLAGSALAPRSAEMLGIAKVD